MGSLAFLKIKNLALISELEIDFDKGLNIITGETGAGKSIIVNSLLLLTGDRASSSLIRKDEDFCEIEAVFNTEDNKELIIKRVITKNRNKIKINNEFSTISKLKEITENLIDFSSQTKIFFNTKNQIELYDSFCELTEKVKEYQNLLKKYKNLKSEIERLKNKNSEIDFKIDVLKFQLKELESINLEDIDELSLKNEIEYYENMEKIKDILNKISIFFEKIFPEVTDLKGKVCEISNLKSSFKEIQNLLENIELELDELNHLCAKHVSEFNDIDVNRVNELIFIEEKINNLKRKFKKNTIKDLISYKRKIKLELEKLENYEFSISEKEKLLEKIEKKLKEISMELHEIRKSKKLFFENKIEEILKKLKMDKAKFILNIEKLQDFNEFGITKIEYLISTNPGEAPKPINEIASGGEKSRIILALKSFLSDYMNIPVIIFDEIDVGTGGEVAFYVGKLLKQLSKKHQVFAITHFPQVASFADNHYKVYKFVKDGLTFTQIKKLNYEERIEEIARMISGIPTLKAKQSAEELIYEAQKSNS